MSGAGYGFWGPAEGNNHFNVLDFIIQQRLARTRTMMLVKVKSVTNNGNLAPVGYVSVQPLVNMIDGIDNSTEYGEIKGIPYSRVQGGGNAVIIDPEVDDIGWMTISDRDTSTVKRTKAVSNPGTHRRHDISDGVYLGGILNKVPDQFVQFNSSGVTITDKNGNHIVMDTDGIKINGVLFDRSTNVSNVSNLTTAGTASLGGGSQAVKLSDGSNATKVFGT
jgi:hypothetical protein